MRAIKWMTRGRSIAPAIGPFSAPSAPLRSFSYVDNSGRRGDEEVFQLAAFAEVFDEVPAAGGDEGLFVVTEADAAAIRAVFTQEGKLSAAIELRRRFPGIADNAKARAADSFEW